MTNSALFTAEPGFGTMLAEVSELTEQLIVVGAAFICAPLPRRWPRSSTPGEGST